MRGTRKRIIGAAMALLSPAFPFPTSAPAPPKKVSSYDGGVVFLTDGGIPGGPCLRLSGRLTGVFFAGLKRIDGSSGTEFLRGSERVTQFPEKVFVHFVIRDHPCPEELAPAGPPAHLTREVMFPLRLAFYWKRGLQLRPIEGVTRKTFSVQPVKPYAKDLAPDLPERYVWSYEFAVPSAGIPLTDHFVLVLRMPDDRIVARVAARL